MTSGNGFILNLEKKVSSLVNRESTVFNFDWYIYWINEKFKNELKSKHNYLKLSEKIINEKLD